MRQLPSFLWLNRFGVYYVRLRLPYWLRRLAPTAPADVRRSLKTRDPAIARVDALQAAAHWEKAISELEDMRKKGAPPSQFIVKIGGITAEIERGPNDDPADLEHIVAGITRQAYGLTSVALAAADAMQPEGTKPAQESATTAWLFDVIQAYGYQKRAKGDYTEDTWKKSIEPALRAFRELISTHVRSVSWEGQTITIDDLRMNEITISMMDQFVLDMLALPSHTGQSNRVARRSNPFSPSFKAALTSGKPPANKRTVQKKLEFVATFLHWADDRGGHINQANRLIAPLKIKAGDPESYVAFTDEDLKAIFEAPSFSQAEHEWLYWVPLLALYTGARLGELAQLQSSDFERRKDFLYMCVTDKDKWKTGGKVASKVVKKLKTKNAERLIPIHPHLLELGLREYIDIVQLTSPDGFLFPSLKPSAKAPRPGQPAGIGSQEAWSKKASRPLNDMLRAVGVGASREKVIHSFRATLNARADEFGLPVDKRSRLLGHSPKTINEKHYLQNPSTKQLEDFMSQLDFKLKVQRYRAGQAARSDALDASEFIEDL